jgi:hypothetical protein
MIRLKNALMFLFFLCAIAPIRAQEAALSGQVNIRDHSGPAQGVRVTFFDLKDLRQAFTTVTDVNGHFTLRLPGLSNASSAGQLLQNFPNPFNPGTVIPYAVSELASVHLVIYNILGQQVRTLVNETQSAGRYRVTWDARDSEGHGVAAGVYLYRLQINDFSATRRMVLLDGGISAAPGAAVSAQILKSESPIDSAPDYGVTISGPGIATFVRTEFPTGAILDGLTFEVDLADAVRSAKLVQATPTLGDVNNDGNVNISDALIIATYDLDNTTGIPNGGDISQGDVNGDGEINISDALIVATFGQDPLNPALPAGIGRPLGEGGRPVNLAEGNFKLTAYDEIILQPSYTLLYFQVTDAEGKGVDLLRTEDFEAQDDSQLLSSTESDFHIRKMVPLEHTLQTVLLIDNSISMANHLEQSKAVAISLVENGAPGQIFAVYEFSENEILLQDFTDDKVALREVINGIKMGAHNTNLFSTIRKLTGRVRTEYNIGRNSFRQGFLVVLTDGRDTQGQVSLSEALGFSGVYTLGLGDDVDAETLRRLGSGSFFDLRTTTDLIARFTEIQSNLISAADSFYFLKYLSPKRGSGGHTLSLSIRGNRSNTISVSYNSSGFYSVSPGLTLSTTPQRPQGIGTLSVFEMIDRSSFYIHTFFADNLPQYTWHIADETVFTVTPDRHFPFLVNLTPVGEIGQTTELRIEDTANGLSDNLTLMIGPTIEFADRNFESFVRDTINKKSGTILRQDQGVEHLLKLETLDLSNRKITDLTGIKLFTSLDTLNLVGNLIDDLSPLSELTSLKYLRLGNEGRAGINLSTLPSLPSLEYLFE